ARAGLPPLAVESTLGADGAVERVEIRHVHVGRRKVEDPRVLAIRPRGATAPEKEYDAARHRGAARGPGGGPAPITMTQGGTMRRPLRARVLAVVWLAALCVATWLLVPGSAGAVSSKACDGRVNDSPEKLVPCIKTDDLWQHMQAFQAIADANPGPDGHPSRNSGEPGYRASVDYVAGLMRQAGYDVTIQPYTIDYFAYQGTPSMSEL